MIVVFNLVFEYAPETDIFVMDTSLLTNEKDRKTIEEANVGDWIEAKKLDDYELTDSEGLIDFVPGMAVDKLLTWYVL